ncbi:MAG: adenosylmethionine--8-amino-7-oxononanoate transaminase [Kordiimonadaceae bacterium]|nr:adenosylmethionine--8-amino-7-oxononanoate transaminase [Kordiimonadaceae bacterium]
MKINSDWYTKGMEHIWLPYTQMKTAKKPQPVIATEGVRLRLADGTELVDGISSWWAAVHGYNHPHIVEAMKDQVEVMPHSMFGGLVNEPALKLATRLAEMLPGDLNRSFFAESGSVSVEISMKMAMQYFLNKGEKRTRFVHFRDTYHGDTLAAMAVGDTEQGMHANLADANSGNLLTDLPRTEAEAVAFKAFLKENAHDVAAVITEPMVQGAGGMIFHGPETLRWIREACDEAGVLFIVDEIFTGFYRTGSRFAIDQAGIVPDMITLSKALSGGVSPLSVCVATDKIFDAFYDDDPEKALMHGPTYMGHALGCAAANASLDLFEAEDYAAKVEVISDQMARELAPCRALPMVKDVRTMGAIGVVQLDDTVDLDALKPMFVDAGVWIRPFGTIVYLTPPLIIDEEDLRLLTTAIVKVLSSL